MVSSPDNPDIVKDVIVGPNIVSLLSFTSVNSVFLSSSVELKMNNVNLPRDHHQISYKNLRLILIDRRLQPKKNIN